MDTKPWHDELRTILASYEYAYAVGASCSMGAKAPAEKALLRRVRVLEALIKEHEE